MDKMFTQHIISLENEAAIWLEIFDKLPDDAFDTNFRCLDSSVKNLKSFARAYQCICANGTDIEFVIN